MGGAHKSFGAAAETQVPPNIIKKISSYKELIKIDLQMHSGDPMHWRARAA